MEEIERKRVAQFLARNSRKRAKIKGIEHTVRWFDIEVPEVCPITLEKMQQNKVQMGPNSFTLDRKDPSKGYTKDNVWVISWQANKLKAEMSIDALERLLKHLKGE